MREIFNLLPLAGLVTGAAVVIESQIFDNPGTNTVNTNNVTSVDSCKNAIPAPSQQLFLREAVLPPETSVRDPQTVEIQS